MALRVSFSQRWPKRNDNKALSRKPQVFKEMAREVQGRCLRFSVSTNYCLGGGNDLLLGASLLVQFESRIRLQRNAGDPSSIPRPNPKMPGGLQSAAAAAAAKSLQSCPTLCDPMDGSPPGSPVPGILQARTLEWVASSVSNAWQWIVKGKSLSRVAAYQAPPSVGFSRQESWSGVSLPSPKIHTETHFVAKYLNEYDYLGTCILLDFPYFK